MRPDSRADNALRPVTIERDYIKDTLGSVLISFGDTKVLCAVSSERRVPGWLRDSGKGWVTAEYAMLPVAARDRISRDAYRKGRAMEISRLIGRSLRSVVNLHEMGEMQLTIDCDVIQADGGTRTAAITGAYVALHDAMERLKDEGHWFDLPLTAPCAAVSVGIIDGAPRLDLCYQEDANAEVDLNLVMRGDGKLIEIQGSAEGNVFSRDQLDAMLALGEKGLNELFALQQEALDVG